MKRFIIIVLTGIAVALVTAGPAEARDRSCYRSSHYSHGHSSSYSRGYCAPRYSRSYSYCPPTHYRSYSAPSHYRSYRSCEPRYYSSHYHSPRISVGGLGIFFR